MLDRTEHQQRVNEFMFNAGQEFPPRPTEPDEKTRILRARLILEEALETIRDGLGVEVWIINDNNEQICLEKDTTIEFFTESAEFNMVEAIDGCADLSVVTIGTMTALGVSDKPILEEVDANNLAKFGPRGYRDEGGKWIKPPDHQPPDIKGLLKEQGWEE